MEMTDFFLSLRFLREITEIKVEESRASKFAILGALNFDF